MLSLVPIPELRSTPAKEISLGTRQSITDQVLKRKTTIRPRSRPPHDPRRFLSQGGGKQILRANAKKGPPQ